MTNKNSKKLGFSLIELSIVILIIGILVAGVTQGSRLVGRSRLAAAKSLTQSAPVTGIQGLTMWFDSTSDDSFKTVEAVDGAALSAWYDIQELTNKNTAAIANGAAAAGTAIQYKENIINGLPVVRFSNAASSNYFFQLNSGSGIPSLTNSAYTAFYVVRFQPANSTFTTGVWPLLASETTAISTSSTTSMTFLNATGTAGRFQVCDVNTGTAGTAATGVCSPGTTAGYLYGTSVPQIITVVNENDTSLPAANNVRSIFTTGGSGSGTNGATTQINSTAVSTGTSITASTLSIGRNATNYFTGDIGEIIVFSRALTVSERRSVECYLGKKWGINGANCS